MKITEQRKQLIKALSSIKEVRNVQVRLGKPARLQVLIETGGDEFEVRRAALAAGLPNPVDVIRMPESVKEELFLH